MPKILLLADFAEEYFKKLLLGIARYSKENGPWVFCRMPYYYYENLGLSGIIKWANEWGADGMIAQLNNKNDLPGLKDAGFPIIVPDLKERFKQVPNITGDYFKTGKMGAEYFLNKGYKNFGFYGYSSFVWSRERGIGFSNYLNEKGFDVSFFEGEHDPHHEMWFYKPSALSDWLSNLPKPVAIMACDDNCGQQITEASKVAGLKISEEIAVLGIDNDELICSLSDPSLSSISLDAEQGGYNAAALLSQMMNSNSKGYDITILPKEIITRQSTDMYASANRQIAKALRFIHQNFDQPITVSEIASYAAMSRRSLEIKFKATTGDSTYRYITKLRTDKFAKLLIDTEKPIGQIALESGLAEIKNVSRQFKQQKGSNPAQFRKNHQ